MYIYIYFVIGLKPTNRAHLLRVRFDEMMIAIGLTKLSDIKVNLCHFVSYNAIDDDQKSGIKPNGTFVRGSLYIFFAQ